MGYGKIRTDDEAPEDALDAACRFHDNCWADNAAEDCVCNRMTLEMLDLAPPDKGCERVSRYRVSSRSTANCGARLLRTRLRTNSRTLDTRSNVGWQRPWEPNTSSRNADVWVSTAPENCMTEPKCPSSRTARPSTTQTRAIRLRRMLFLITMAREIMRRT